METKISLKQIVEGEKIQELINLLPELKSIIKKSTDKTPPHGTKVIMIDEIGKTPKVIK